MTTSTPATVRGEIVRLANLSLNLHEFARAAARVLRRAVPFDGVAVVALDPATALAVDKWIDNSLTGNAGWRLGEIEFHEPDVNKLRHLAASGRRAASMSAATGGKLDRSRRYRELLRPRGFGDELRTVCTGASGVWGLIVMHRDRGAPHFAAKDVDLLASVSGELAEAFQRVSVRHDVSAGAGDRDPGLLLLDAEGGVEMANGAAAGWLEELRGTAQMRQLPLVVTAVAERAQAIASGRSDAAATARIRTVSGRWLVVRGSLLANETHVRTAVTLEPARAPELAELIADAYGLSARERRVTELVAQGLPTAAIADRLLLSTHTVQDHLKAVFDKVDVSSRGELVARLFVDHYQVAGRLSDPRRREAVPAAG